MGTLSHHLSGLIFLARLLNHQQYVIISLKTVKSYHFTNLDFPHNSRGPIYQPPNAVSNYMSIFRQKIKQLHPRKLTCPLERDYFNRKFIFQPLTFRGHSFVFRGVYGWSWDHPYFSWEDTFVEKPSYEGLLLPRMTPEVYRKNVQNTWGATKKPGYFP